MGNVAELSLCKELYELSGWDDSPFWYTNKYPDEGEIAVLVDSYEWDSYPGHGDYRTYPAYDLGYLLRKLLRKDIQVQYHSDMRRWSAFSPIEKNPKLSMPFADNPEDAVVKLAIELFKQGILTKEAS